MIKGQRLVERLHRGGSRVCHFLMRGCGKGSADTLVRFLSYCTSPGCGQECPRSPSDRRVLGMMNTTR